MARLTVTPTRMELKRLRKRLSIAKRGHKMLKDKQDSLVQAYLGLKDEALLLRRELEGDLKGINEHFVLASCGVPDEMLYQNMSYDSRPVETTFESRRILGVEVPVFKPVYRQEEGRAREAGYPYSMESTSCDIDEVVIQINRRIPLMLELAEKEKACQILSEEIRTTRRRVNALEYRTIVDLEETITYILMKIDENDRNTTAKLMKLGDGVL